jgi:hypothetical protein
MIDERLAIFFDMNDREAMSRRERRTPGLSHGDFFSFSHGNHW